MLQSFGLRDNTTKPQSGSEIAPLVAAAGYTRW